MRLPFVPKIVDILPEGFSAALRSIASTDQAEVVVTCERCKKNFVHAVAREIRLKQEVIRHECKASFNPISDEELAAVDAEMNANWDSYRNMSLGEAYISAWMKVTANKKA